MTGTVVRGTWNPRGICTSQRQAEHRRSGEKLRLTLQGPHLYSDWVKKGNVFKLQNLNNGHAASLFGP